MLKNNSFGQAIIEYLMLFGLMSLIAIGMVNAMSRVMGGTVGNLGRALSDNLSVGVCAEYCFYNGYKNKAK